MKIAIVLTVLVIGTLVFHFVSPWYLTPIASNWDAIDSTIDITFWVTGIVFVAVNLFLAYVVYRFQFKATNKAHYEPENKRLEIGLTIITTIGVAAMLAPGLFVWAKFIEEPADALVIEAVGQQWTWSFRLPGPDGALGKVDTRLITESNPMGIDPNDPRGMDDLIIANNELHLELDQPVKVLLRSKDVLHNFAVPQFRVKMDLVPGSVTYLWFTPTREGTFDILCEELCGLAHHTMRGKVIVESPEAHQNWLAQQNSFARTQQIKTANLVNGKSLYAACGACHGSNGEGNQALNAPKLSGLTPSYISRQLRYYQQGIRGIHEQDIYGQQMQAMAAMVADPQSIVDVAGYLGSLNSDSSPVTISGDSTQGQRYYTTCGTCHGGDGKGKAGLNAPMLAGQHDWYIKRQLSNYKLGIRGAHPNDQFGIQMTLMAKMLRDEDAVNDVIAYINTLQPDS